MNYDQLRRMTVWINRNFYFCRTYIRGKFIKDYLNQKRNENTICHGSPRGSGPRSCCREIKELMACWQCRSWNCFPRICRRTSWINFNTYWKYWSKRTTTCTVWRSILWGIGSLCETSSWSRRASLCWGTIWCTSNSSSRTTLWTSSRTISWASYPSSRAISWAWCCP